MLEDSLNLKSARQSTSNFDRLPLSIIDHRVCESS